MKRYVTILLIFGLMSVAANAAMSNEIIEPSTIKSINKEVHTDQTIVHDDQFTEYRTNIIVNIELKDGASRRFGPIIDIWMTSPSGDILRGNIEKQIDESIALIKRVSESEPMLFVNQYDFCYRQTILINSISVSMENPEGLLSAQILRNRLECGQIDPQKLNFRKD